MLSTLLLAQIQATLILDPQFRVTRQSAELIPTTRLPWNYLGPFVKAQNGILGITDNRIVVIDPKKNKFNRAVFLKNSDLQPLNDLAITKTKTGRIIVAFIDNSNLEFKWLSREATVSPNTRSDLYSVYSDDDGKTFTGITRVQRTYTGAARNMIQASDGSILLPSISIEPGESKFKTLIHRSTDQGESWSKNPFPLEIDGKGHHDGIIEGSLILLKNNDVLGVFRTNNDFLYQSISKDNGKTWSTPSAMNIQSSSSPAALLRLSDERILIAYSPIYPSNMDSYRRFGGSSSQKRASWFRREIWVRTSSDEGKTWSAPQAVVKDAKSDTSYPQLIESPPGTIIMTTYQGKNNLKFQLKDIH